MDDYHHRNRGIEVKMEHFPNFIYLHSTTPKTTITPTEQNGRRFADDILKRIFLNKNVRNLIQISLKFVPKDSIDNESALVQVIA